MQRPEAGLEEAADAVSSVPGHARGVSGQEAAFPGGKGGSVAVHARKPKRETSPAQRALGLLVRREHSRRELLAKLTARGVDADAAAQAVDRMTAEGWQDNTRFAVSLARMRASTGYGPVRIRAELETHHIGADAIAAALASLDDSGDADWPARARALMLRRYGETVFDDSRLQRKAADFLFRRGFDADSVRSAMRRDA